MAKEGKGIGFMYKGLIALEVVLSTSFIAIGHFLGNPYLRGVGVGLLIAWVTGVIAYLAYMHGIGFINRKNK